MDKELDELLLLIGKASEEMISYGNQSTFSYFDTCEDLGLYIQEIITKVKEGEIKELSKLWYIFAPTGVWDDSGGSQELANEIFEILNGKYYPS